MIEATEQQPCPACGMTGRPMVDWHAYACELQAVLREVLSWTRPPGWLEERARCLLDGRR